jgi:hypothetical protein
VIKSAYYPLSILWPIPKHCCYTYSQEPRKKVATDSNIRSQEMARALKSPSPTPRRADQQQFFPEAAILLPNFVNHPARFSQIGRGVRRASVHPPPSRTVPRAQHRRHPERRLPNLEAEGCGGRPTAWFTAINKCSTQKAAAGRI